MFLARMALLVGLAPAFMLGATLDASAQKSQAQTARSPAENDFRNWLTAFAVNGVRVSMGMVRVDDAAASLKIENLMIAWPGGDNKAGADEQPGPELHIGSLNLKSLKAENGGIRFESATVDKIRFGAKEAMPNDLRVERVEMGGSFLPNLAGPNFDPQKPISSQIAMLRVLTKMEVRNLAAAKISAGDAFSLAGFAVSDVSAGKISLAQISELKSVFVRANPLLQGGPAPVQMTAETFAVKGINLESYIRLFENSAYLDAGSARPWSDLVESIAAGNVKISDGGVNVSAFGVQIGAVTVRQFNESLTDIFDRSALDQTYLNKNPIAAAKVANAFRNSFAIVSASVKNVDMSLPVAGGNLNATLDAGALSNLTAGALDQLQLEGLDVADPTGRAKLARLDIGGVNLAVPSARVPTPGADAQMAFAGLPTINSIVASGAIIDTEMVDLSLDTLDLSMSYFIGATPTNYKAKLDHLKFATDQIAVQPIRQALTDFGYKDVDLSLNFSGAWEDSSSSFAIDAVSLTGKDMGALSISGSIVGITRASIENPQELLPRELMAGGVRNFRLSFENGSLFERLMSQIAKQNGKSIDEIKKLISANMPAIMAGISPADIRNKFIFAAISFINDPQILSLSARTSDVAAIRDVVNSLAEPQKLPSLLKLDASANARKR